MRFIVYCFKYFVSLAPGTLYTGHLQAFQLSVKHWILRSLVISLVIYTYSLHAKWKFVSYLNYVLKF